MQTCPARWIDIALGSQSPCTEHKALESTEKNQYTLPRPKHRHKNREKKGRSPFSAFCVYWCIRVRKHIFLYLGFGKCILGCIFGLPRVWHSPPGGLHDLNIATTSFPQCSLLEFFIIFRGPAGGVQFQKGDERGGFQFSETIDSLNGPDLFSELPFLSSPFLTKTPQSLTASPSFGKERIFR